MKPFWLPVTAGPRVCPATRRTIADVRALQEELGRIRAQGFAVDNEERTEGMRCVAAPIRTAHGETIAGLSVSDVVSRVTPERVAEIAST